MFDHLVFVSVSLFSPYRCLWLHSIRKQSSVRLGRGKKQTNKNTHTATTVLYFHSENCHLQNALCWSFLITQVTEWSLFPSLLQAEKPLGLPPYLTIFVNSGLSDQQQHTVACFVNFFLIWYFWGKPEVTVAHNSSLLTNLQH